MPAFDLHPPLTGEGRRVILGLVKGINDWLLGLRQKHRQSWAHSKELLTDADAEFLCDAAVNFSFGAFEVPVRFRSHHGFERNSPLVSECQALEPIQLVRLLAVRGQIRPTLIGDGARRALSSYRRVHPGLGLRELGAVLRAVGIDSLMIAHEYLDTGFFRWSAEATWPFFVEHLDALAWALSGKRVQPLFAVVLEVHGQYTVELSGESDPHCRSNALDALDCFPRVPPPLSDALWKMALDPAKTFRKRAQRVLNKEPGNVSRVVQALGSRQATARESAARWLSDLRNPDSIANLQKAVNKEKNDGAKDAMMSALDTMGVPFKGFLDRSEVAKRAARELASRGVPKGLAWVPFEQLPEQRWRESLEKVPKELAAWWVVQAHTAKSPQPRFQLRRHIELVDRVDRESFGKSLLQAWIDYDTMPSTVERARAAAERHITRLDGIKRLIELIRDSEKREVLSQRIPSKQELVEHLMGAPGGSAIGCKGVLSVCAACGGEMTAAMAADFVRRWYGLRAAQSKALVQMMGWIEHPAAVQFLTATAKRFRTRGIREEAHKAVVALAERKGWTVEEFADRMIPDCGLDEHVRLRLEFGSRAFIVEMDSGFRFHIRDEDGVLKSDLPKPGVKDDAAAAAESRRAFAKAKKQAREVVREQTDRLFGAMCSQRLWRFDAWGETLAGHPIVGVFCRRLVWRTESGALFRPRGRAEFIDASGTDVVIASETRILLAHDYNTPPEQALPWLEQFENYAIEPLFAQFNRGLPELSAAMLQRESIEDFRGFVIGGFALRNYAKKLGYLRGEALDGPEFFHYYKPYPELRVEVWIEFSGNEIPEVDQVVALERLSFQRMPGAGASDRRGVERMMLADVAPILLLESFRDLREIAESGEGFDSEWEKRVRGEG